MSATVMDATLMDTTVIHATVDSATIEPTAVRPDTVLLEARGLGYAWPGCPPLFEGVDLVVREREIVALLGASGCGKSTLLRLLAGLAGPSAGSLTLGGTPVTGPDPRTALLFQQPSLLPWLRVEDNVAFGLDFVRQPRLGEATRRERVRAALTAVGLPQAGRLRPNQLSGGMAQRVALARALAREPRLLLADEPFSALDAITRAGMQALLLEAVRRVGSAVLLVTHDIDEALTVADRVLLLGRCDGRRAPAIRGAWTLPESTDPDARQALRPRIHAALLDSMRAGA
jgi:NitT/TauT family transport system ATP-binding protein